MPDAPASEPPERGVPASEPSEHGVPASEPSEHGVPARVGPYRVGARIGGGGMGRVHEAVHEPSGREVAIKLVREGASERGCARLLREAKAARAAAGDHVVEVLDAGLGEDGLPFVVMERLDGADLGAVLRREGRLELDLALEVATQILIGLEGAHGAGVVHRDLKPENVVVLGRGDDLPGADAVAIKIVDFGVSKVRTQGVLVPGSLTREGVVLGTPLYMSPEQAQGLPDVDERSDLWSTGAILYQCLAGRAPHAGATYEQIVVAVCSTDAPDVRTWNPAVPEPVARVIARALARDRRRRFRDARGMREALERAASGDVDAAEHDEVTLLDPAEHPASAPGATAALPLLRPRSRGRRATTIAVGALSVIAGGVMALLALRALGLDGPAETEPGAREPAASGPSGGERPVLDGPGDPAPPTVVLAAETEAGAEPAVTTTTRPIAPPPASATAPRVDAATAPRSTKRGVAAGLELRER